MIEFSEPKNLDLNIILLSYYITLLSIAFLFVEYRELKYITKLLVVRVNNTTIFLFSTKLHCFIHFYH